MTGLTRRGCVLTLCGLLWAASSVGAPPRIAIITAAPAITENLSARDLSKVFRRKLLINTAGITLIPVNLAVSDPLRRAWSVALFGLEPSEMELYWNEQYFHGISPPIVVQSTEAMLRFVQRTRGAIGYVLDCELDSRVHAIAYLPVPRESTRLAARCAR